MCHKNGINWIIGAGCCWPHVLHVFLLSAFYFYFYCIVQHFFFAETLYIHIIFVFFIFWNFFVARILQMNKTKKKALKKIFCRFSRSLVGDVCWNKLDSAKMADSEVFCVFSASSDSTDALNNAWIEIFVLGRRSRQEIQENQEVFCRVEDWKGWRVSEALWMISIHLLQFDVIWRLMLQSLNFCEDLVSEFLHNIIQSHLLGI